MASKAQANFIIVNTKCNLLHIPTNSGQENPLSRYAQETTQDAPMRSFVNFQTICKHQNGFVGKSLRFLIRVLNTIKLKFHFTNKFYSILFQHFH